MASRVDSSVLDNGLASLKSGATIIHICSAEPTNYANVATVTLGNKTLTAGNVFPGAIAAGTPNGRKVTTVAVTDGSVTATGTASHWAIVSGTVLLATSTLSATQAVTASNTFTLGAFDIRLPSE